MATHLKIKTHEDNCTHFDTGRNNYTLCGLETGGDETLNISIGKPVKTKVNCPDCVRTVEFCHRIDKKEFTNKYV